MKIIKIKEILNYLCDAKVKHDFYGDISGDIRGFSSLKNYKGKTITWIKKQEIANETNTVPFLAVVDYGIKVRAENIIYVKNSKQGFFNVVQHFYGNKAQAGRIGEGTFISSKVQLGENVSIGHNCTIEGEIIIGSNTVIGNSVVIVNRVVVGKNCFIQSLSAIGEDGFGFSEDADGTKTMVKHFGGVLIGNNVFIGSHVNIARGTIDDTVIEDGVKIAPSTHIGHNNYIGKNSTIICSNIYGSIEIGENAYITASTIKNQSKIGSHALVGMGSVVTKDVEAEKVVVGAPAKVLRDNR